MNATCSSCHVSAPKYYVSADVQAMISAMGQEINTGNLSAARRIQQGIGMESCYRCHVLHMPAQFAKEETKQVRFPLQKQGLGGIDKFRIKIWNKSTVEVVYNDQMDALEDANPTPALSGGSIVMFVYYEVNMIIEILYFHGLILHDHYN